MKKVGFVAHGGRPEALAVASELSHWLTGQGVSTRRLETEPVEAQDAASQETFASGLDLIVCVGGDGTFLRSARIANGASVPVVGVKVGRLGFLTEIEPEEAPAVISEVLDGRGKIEQRMALTATSEALKQQHWALNEVMVEKGSRHRLIKLAVELAGTRICTFSADGVLVATSTGSTAYSFSARGPIVSPAVDCMIVTPIAAHMVFDRSFVVGPDEGVELEVVGDEAGVLSTDGQASVEMPVGARVRIAAAQKPTLMVRRSDDKNFFDIVREKFGLPSGAEGP